MANNDISQTQALFNNNGVNFSNNKKYFRYNNFFYTLADSATSQLYIGYLAPCLEAYDGFIWGCHDESIGLLPQGLLQATAQTLKQKLFKYGIDFNCVKKDGSPDREAYFFLKKWANNCDLTDKLKTSFIYSFAGGTTLFKLNGVTNKSSVDVYRIDKFIPDLTNLGKLRRVYSYINSIPDKKKSYWVLTEERFIQRGIPYRVFKYHKSSTLVNQNLPADFSGGRSYRFDELPEEIRKFHFDNYKSITLDQKERLPFNENIGAVLIKYNEGIPGMEHLGLGQPVSDIGLQDSFSYDMSFQFGSIERFVARPRVLIPSGFVNRNSRNGLNNAMNNIFYENYTPTSDNDTKPQQIAFPLRAGDIKVDRETILQNFAMKIGVSGDLLADWASKTGGTSGTSATAIIHSDKKTDNYLLDKKTIIETQINKIIKLLLQANGFDCDASLVIFPETSLDFATEANTISLLWKNKMIPADIAADRIGREYDRATRERIASFMENHQQQEMLEQQARILSSITPQTNNGGGNSDYDGKTKYNEDISQNAKINEKTKVDRNVSNTQVSDAIMKN